MELKVIKNVAPQIHPTAIIDPTAVLHKNVVIGPYAVSYTHLDVYKRQSRVSTPCSYDT